MHKGMAPIHMYVGSLLMDSTISCVVSNFRGGKQQLNFSLQVAEEAGNCRSSGELGRLFNKNVAVVTSGAPPMIRSEFDPITIAKSPAAGLATAGERMTSP